MKKTIISSIIISALFVTSLVYALPVVPSYTRELDPDTDNKWWLGTTTLRYKGINAVSGVFNDITVDNFNGLLFGTNGTISTTSTSTLGLPTFSDLSDYFKLSDWFATTTDALDEGSTNQYWTIDRFTSALLGGYNAILGNSTTTNATTTNLAVTGSASLPYGTWIGDTLGTKSIQFTDYTIPTTFASGNKINKISAKNDLNFVAMENALFVFAETGEDPLIGLGREDSNYLTLIGTNLDDNTLTITQIDETVSPVVYNDFIVGTEKLTISSGLATSTINFNDEAGISLSPSDTMRFTGASGGYYFDGTTTASCISNDGVNCFANLWFQNGDDIYYEGGFVGIGTTTPQAPLHLVTTSTADPVLILGNSTNVAGPKAISIGYGAEAMGTSSLAIGDDTDADGENSVSIGKDSNSKGLNSTAVGKTASAKGDYSLALGNFVNASNTYALAIGNNQTVTGEGAIGMGFNGNVSGAYGSLIGGNNNNVSGGLSGSFGGFYNTLSGFQSTILGGQYLTNAGSRASILGGTGNTILTGGDDSIIAGGAGNVVSGQYIGAVNSINSYASGMGASLLGTLQSTTTGMGALALSGQYNQSLEQGAINIGGQYSSTTALGATQISSQYVGVDGIASMAIGAYDSYIHNSAPSSLLLFASSSDIYAPAGMILGGENHTLSGVASSIWGGVSNTISGMYSYALGSYNTVTGNNSIGINLSPYNAPASSTLSQSNTMAIMGGLVGIGTTSPIFNLEVASSTNWLSLKRPSEDYYLNFGWEQSTIDYPLISGLASSTAILGGNLSAVGLKDRVVVVGDDNPNLSFSTYTGILSSLATLAFDTATEIIQWSGAKSYKWFDYDTGEAEFVTFDAENLTVGITGTTTIGTSGQAGVLRMRDSDDAGYSCFTALNGTLSGAICD